MPTEPADAPFVLELFDDVADYGATLTDDDYETAELPSTAAAKALTAEIVARNSGQ